MVSIAAMLWALDLFFRPKAQAGGLSDIQIVLFEHVALVLLFIPSLIKHQAEWRKLSLRGWAGLGFIAIFGSAIATIMISMAYRSGSPLLTALLQKTQPIFAIILAGILLGEKRKLLFWPLFLGALAGTYLLAFGFGRVEFSSKVAPVFLALGAATIWGTCTVIGRLAIKNLTPSVVAGWRFLIALPFLVALNLGNGFSSMGAHVNGATIGLVLAIVVFPDALGMMFYYTGLKRTPASLATLAELAFPATALIVSLIDQKQSLNYVQGIGLGTLLVCLHLIQSSRSVAVAKAG